MANGISSMDVASTIKVGDKVMTLKEFKDWVKRNKAKRLLQNARRKWLRRLVLSLWRSRRCSNQ